MGLGRGTVIAAFVVSALVASPSPAVAATKPPKAKDVAALQKALAKTGRLVEPSTSFQGTKIVAATEAPFGAIAAGLTDGRVSIWTTKDAKKWTRVPEEALGAPAEALDAANASGGVLLDADADGAVVVVGSDVLTTRDGRKFAFSSRDTNGIALRTEPVQVDRLTYGNAPPRSLAVGPERSVLVGSGSWSRQAGGPSPSFVPTMWWSTDRTRWAGTPLKPANATPGIANRVVTLDDGTFVAAGANTADGAGSTIGRGDDAAVWTSPDGETWALADAAAFAAPGTQEIAHLAALGDRLVAAGLDAPGGGQPTVAAIWMSADAGRTWSRVTLDPAVFPAGSKITGVVATPRGFVASGANGSSAVTGRWTYWVSADGTTWTQAYTDRIFNDSPAVVFAFGRDVVALDGADAYAGSANVAPAPASTSVYITDAPAPPKVPAPTTTTTRPAR